MLILSGKANYCAEEPPLYRSKRYEGGFLYDFGEIHRRLQKCCAILPLMEIMAISKGVYSL